MQQRVFATTLALFISAGCSGSEDTLLEPPPGNVAATSAVVAAAATSAVVAVVEAETFALPAGGKVISDGSASGGKAIRLNNNGTATIQMPLGSPSNRIVVRARGRQCNGAPQGSIRVDGVQVLAGDVSSTGWTDYPVTTNTAAGGHALAISFINDYSSGICSRDLFIDKVTFWGTSTPPPPPAAQCSNGIDDDADGKIDYPADPGCTNASDDSEADVPGPPPPPDPSAQLFKGDYETGNLSQWDVCQSIAHNNPCSTMPSHYSIATVSNVRRQGTYAARFELRDGDCPIFGGICYGERTEVQEDGTTTGGREGDERWYQWSTQFSSQFPSNHASQGWGLVNQWHAQANGSPPVGMYVDVADGQWGLRINSQSSPGQFINSYILWKTSLSSGNWQDIKLHIKWSINDASGFVELWHNGVRQTFTGAPCVGQTRCMVRTLVPGGGGTYYKQGYYRNFAVSGTGIVFHDGFTAARTEAGLGGL